MTAATSWPRIMLVFVLGLALGAGGVWAARSSRVVADPVAGTPISLQTGGALAGGSAEGETSAPALVARATDIPEPDLLAALRARAATGYTYEERLAELRRLTADKSGRNAFNDGSGSQERYMRMMALIQPEDIGPLIQILETDPKPGFERDAVLDSWARYDPAALEAWVRGRHKDSLTEEGWNALEKLWAREGGLAAWDKMVSLGKHMKPDEPLPGWSQTYLPVVARDKPLELYARLDAMEDPESRQSALGTLLPLLAAKDFSKAIELARREPQGDFSRLEAQSLRNASLAPNPDYSALLDYTMNEAGDRAHGYRTLLFDAWIQKDPEAARTWLAQYPDDERLAKAAKDSVNSREMLKQMPRTNYESLQLALKDPALANGGSPADFAGLLAQSDPDRAMSVLGEADESTRLRLGPNMVSNLAPYDPAKALRALALIPSGPERRRAAEQLYNAWNSYDPAAATASLASSDSLSDEDRASVQAKLEDGY